MTIKFKTPTIKSDNLTLKPLSIKDAYEIYIIRSTPENLKYVEMKAYEDTARAERFINAVAEDINEGLVSFFGVYLNENPDKLVGTVCLMDPEDGSNSIEIGFEIMDQLKRRGIMKEACKTAITFAFDELYTEKISAVTHKENYPSIKLLESLCFKEGHTVEDNMISFDLNKN